MSALFSRLVRLHQPEQLQTGSTEWWRYRVTQKQHQERQLLCSDNSVNRIFYINEYTLNTKSKHYHNSGLYTVYSRNIQYTMFQIYCRNSVFCIYPSAICIHTALPLQLPGTKQGFWLGCLDRCNTSVTVLAPPFVWDASLAIFSKSWPVQTFGFCSLGIIRFYLRSEQFWAIKG